MRVRQIGIVLLAAAAAAPATAQATHSPSENGPPKDFVTGGGITGIETRFGFTAHSGPAGERPSGHATFKNRAGVIEEERKGHVTCLRVSGNRAVFGIEDRTPSGGTQFRQFFVQDNGEPQNGMPVDLLNEVGRPTSAPRACEDPRLQMGGPIRQGNLQVHDAT
jgi:hypothetical protein